MARTIALAGSPRVEIDGVPVSRLGELPGLALAYLVSERSRPVTYDELADVVWAGLLPATWKSALRVHVAKARAALRAAGVTEALVARDGCYHLLLPAETIVDVEAAAAAVRQARADLEVANPDAARRAAEFAAMIAGRQFLPGARGTWVEQRQRELLEVRLEALELLAHASCETGDFPAAIRAGEEAIAAERFRESAYRHVMAAHRSAGNRGEALRVYERCRRTLTDVLGVSPAPATELAYLELLGDEEADPAPSMSAGRILAGSRPRATSQVMLPSMLRTDQPFEFAGRASERQLLLDACDGSSGAVGPPVVLVAGEAGAGKTRIVAEVAQTLHDRGAIVVGGRCDESLALAYGPFGQALREFSQSLQAADLERSLGPSGNELVRIYPQLLTLLPHLQTPSAEDPDVARYQLFEAVVGWLTALGATRPAVLVLDDLQWATRPTLLLLRHIVRTTTDSALAIIGIYRDSELVPSHPLATLIAELARDHAYTPLNLAGIDEATVAALIQEAGGHPLDGDGQALASAIHRESQGNPFFVGEILRHLHGTRGLRDPDGRWVRYRDISEIGIPESVRHVVVQRIARLPEATGRTLMLASVVGLEFESTILSKVADTTEEEVLDTLEPARAAKLVTESPDQIGAFAFAHAIVRATIVEGVGHARRTRIHFKIAHAIEQLHSSNLDEYLVALAYQYGEAARADSTAVRSAFEYARRAGDHMLDQFAPDDAASYYRDALALDARLPAEAERRCELLLRVGDALTRAARFDEARANYEVAAEIASDLHDGPRLARAALGHRGPPRPSNYRDRDAELLERALELLDESEPALLSLIHAQYARTGAQISMVQWHADEALRLARDLDDPKVLSSALLARCWTSFHPSYEHEQLDLSTQAVASARAGRSQDLLLEALATLFMVADHLDEGIAEQAFEEIRDTTDRGHNDRYYYRAVVPMIEARRLLASGNLDEAEARAASALEMETDESAMVAYFSQLTVIRGLQGRADELLAATSLEFREGDGQLALALHLFSILLHFQSGRTADARQAFRRLAQCGFSALAPEGTWIRKTELAQFADLCARLDDADAAPQLHALVAPYEGSHAHGMLALYFGPFTLFSGMLDSVCRRYDGAIARLTDAQAHLERTGARALELRARAELGYALGARDRDGRGSDLIASARDETHGLGLVDICRRCDELDAKLGATRLGDAGSDAGR